MSHATLIVKVTAKRLVAKNGDLDEAIAEMMAPYNEQDDRYRTFVDEEAEWHEEYKNGTRTMIRTPAGELLSPWDDRFRVPGSFGLGGGTHKTPPDCEEVQIPFREFYSDFRAYAEDWHSAKPDAKTGRYGHWSNPNARWDWYQIGGRWRGFFPLKPDVMPVVGESGAGDNEARPGRGDIVRLSDIDMDAVARETNGRAEKFWEEWQSWLAGTYVEKNPFDGPRSTALRIGLLDVAQGPAISDHTQKAIPWEGQVRENDPRRGWHDVAKIVEHDAFLADYVDCFCPIKTFAALDNDGWHEPGKMGWWGCSSDTPDAYRKFALEFVSRFVKTAGPDDLLVLIDYHI